MISCKLWIEKYAPQELSDFIININLPNELCNTVIYSKHKGVGKTTLSKLLSEHFSELLWKDYEVITPHYFYSSDYLEENKFVTKLQKIVKTFVLNKESFNVIVLDNFDTLSKDIQSKILNIAEKHTYNNCFIFVLDEFNSDYTKLFSLCPNKININNLKEDLIKEKLINILRQEKLILEGFDFDEFIKNRYPDIKTIINDLQHIFILGKLPKDIKNAEFNTTNIFNKIYNLILKEKNWEEVNKLIQQNDYINIKRLNKFIWTKSVEESNVRLIQITSLNEERFSHGADEEIVFISSLIEMVK